MTLELTLAPDDEGHYVASFNRKIQAKLPDHRIHKGKVRKSGNETLPDGNGFRNESLGVLVETLPLVIPNIRESKEKVQLKYVPNSRGQELTLLQKEIIRVLIDGTYNGATFGYQR